MPPLRFVRATGIVWLRSSLSKNGTVGITESLGPESCNLPRFWLDGCDAGVAAGFCSTATRLSHARGGKRRTTFMGLPADERFGNVLVDGVAEKDGNLCNAGLSRDAAAPRADAEPHRFPLGVARAPT